MIVKFFNWGLGVVAFIAAILSYFFYDDFVISVLGLVLAILCSISAQIAEIKEEVRGHTADHWIICRLIKEDIEEPIEETE